MFLISSRDQVVKLGNLMFEFAAGRRIHAENSHKYEIEEFQDLARSTGLRQNKFGAIRRPLLVCTT